MQSIYQRHQQGACIMSFSTRLVFSAIFFILFIAGFSYYQAIHPWPSPLEMYPCFLVTGLVGLFLCSTPRSSH